MSRQDVPCAWSPVSPPSDLPGQQLGRVDSPSVWSQVTGKSPQTLDTALNSFPSVKHRSWPAATGSSFVSRALSHLDYFSDPKLEHVGGWEGRTVG